MANPIHLPVEQHFITSAYSDFCASSKLFFAFCNYSTKNFSPKQFNLFSIAQPNSIERFVHKRKAEFLAGRFAAKEVLTLLNWTSYDVGISKNRAPSWPPGISASITHTQKTALTVAAETSNQKYIGVDLEAVLTKETSAEVKDQIIDQDELRLINSKFLKFEQGLTLAFSAKESLFKALHPKVGKYFDFSTAKFTKLDHSENQFELTVVEDLSPQIVTGTQFTCSFAIVNEMVLTLISEKPVKNVHLQSLLQQIS